MEIKNSYTELLEYLDKIYVRKDHCNGRHETTEKEITTILITQEQIKTKISFIEKICLIIATATVGMLITQIGGVIFK